MSQDWARLYSVMSGGEALGPLPLSGDLYIVMVDGEEEVFSSVVANGEVSPPLSKISVRLTGSLLHTQETQKQEEDEEGQLERRGQERVMG